MNKNTLLFIPFLLLYAACFAQQQPTIKLTQLETSKVVESSQAGQIGLTNAAGKQRYAQYVEIDLTPIGFVPTATGNTANFSEFVTAPDGTKWYIDWQGRGYQFPTGAGDCDYDWRVIADFSCPNAITDSIYTAKYASIGARMVWPTAELLVNDSLQKGVIVLSGNRNARFVLYDNFNVKYSQIEQAGANTSWIMEPGGVFSILTAGSGTPEAPGAPFVYHFSVTPATDQVRFFKYPNTRDDAGDPVNVLTTDASGNLQSHPVSGLGFNSIYTGSGLTFPGGTAETQDFRFITDNNATYNPDGLYGQLNFNGFYTEDATFVETPGVYSIVAGNPPSDQAFAQIKTSDDENLILIGGYSGEDNLTNTVSVSANAGIGIRADEDGTFVDFAFDANNAIFTDGRSGAAQQGLEYQADYSAGILPNNRSIPDVGMVRGIVGDSVKALGANLTALQALATNGYVVKTGAGTFTTRSLVAGTGISITNTDGVAGASTISATSTATAPAGTNDDVQFNRNGVFQAIPKCIIDSANVRFAIGHSSASATLHTRGANNTASLNFLSENLAANNIFQIFNDGTHKLGDTETYPIFYQSQFSGTKTTTYTDLGFTFEGIPASGGGDVFGVNQPDTDVSSGAASSIAVTGIWRPGLSTATHAGFDYRLTLDGQGGAAEGENYGLWIHPTETDPSDFRAIQLENNTGFGIRQSGTAKNVILGQTAFGSTSNPTRAVDNFGETRLRDLTTTTATKLVAADNNGVLSDVTVSTGLDLTGNVLTATGASFDVISPATLAGDQDDYNPTGLNTAEVVRLDGDSGIRAITSLAAGSFSAFAPKRFINIGANPIYFPSQSPNTATAANRFILRNDFYLMPGKSCEIYYDNISSRFRIEGDVDFTGQKSFRFQNIMGSATFDEYQDMGMTATGGNFAAAVPTAGVPAAIAMGTSTSSTGYATVYHSKASNLFSTFGSAHIAVEALVSLPVLSDGTNTFQVAAMISSTTTSNSVQDNNSCGIRYTHAANGGRWEGFSVDNASAITTVDLGTTVVIGTVYLLRTEIDVSRSEIRFYLDGAYVGAITSGLPSAVNCGSKVAIDKLAGTTARLFYVHKYSTEVLLPN